MNPTTEKSNTLNRERMNSETNKLIFLAPSNRSSDSSASKVGSTVYKDIESYTEEKGITNVYNPRDDPNHPVVHTISIFMLFIFFKTPFI